MLGYALVMLSLFFTALLLLFNVFVLLPPKVLSFCILRINPSTFSSPYSTVIPWCTTQASENVVIAVAGHLLGPQPSAGVVGQCVRRDVR